MSVFMVVGPLAMLGAMGGIQLLRKGRTVLGRALLLSVLLPFAVLFADSAASGQWFVAVVAAGGVGLAAVAWFGIPKVVSPG